MPDAIGQTPALPLPRIPAQAPATPAANKPTLAPVDSVVLSRPALPVPAMPKQPAPAAKPGLFQRINDFFADPNRKVATIALGLLGAMGGGYMAWAGMAAPMVTVPLQLGCFAVMLLAGLASKK